MAMKKRVGKLLLKAGLISQGQFDAAVQIQEETGAELIDILFSLGAVEPNAFMDFLMNYPGVLPSDLKELEIDGDLLGKVPGDVAHAARCLWTCTGTCSRLPPVRRSPP